MGGIRMPNYVNKKCKNCGQIFEVRIDKQNELYGEYCAICFFDNVVENIYGELRLKREDEKKNNLEYKKELQDVTHRGKTKV